MIRLITQSEIAADLHDIVAKNTRDKKRNLIDVAIPSDQNTSIKVSEKSSKYKDLEIEIARICQVKIEIIPVVLGALRAIRNVQRSSSVTSQEIFKEIQKTTLLRTGHILRKVLSIHIKQGLRNPPVP